MICTFIFHANPTNKPGERDGFLYGGIWLVGWLVGWLEHGLLFWAREAGGVTTGFGTTGMDGSMFLNKRTREGVSHAILLRFQILAVT